MSDKLPDLISPLLFAERRALLSGVIPLAAFPRLADSIAVGDGQVSVNAVFDKHGKRVLVTGDIKTTLSLQCQTCLQIMDWPLDIVLNLAVVSSLQDAEALCGEHEPLLLNGEKTSFYEMIEDEILLALPDFPRHDNECLANNQSQSEDFSELAAKNIADNPFLVLAKLKKTGD